MGPTELRELGPEDVDALQGLLESVPEYAERITGYPPGPSDGLSALIGVPDGFDPAGKHGWGLWEGADLVAFADVLVGYPVPSTAFVGLLLVRGDRHRQGIGRAVHDAVVERVRASVPEVGRLRLGIVQTNAAVAEPFWRALGYAPTGEEKPYGYDHLSSTVALWERGV
ncbi:GNAT family N-acetyltransferase [Curtobacterium sp. SP.BCo]|uniref:GNAT family N-acetyltransferase n=1 Tax=Curtobacterium sp. SP.BCo TaxID=3435229 RepID=UPI003F73C934